jgi:hypothetical protein
MGYFWGVTLPTVGRFSVYKRKFSETWLVYDSETPVEVHLNNERFCLFLASIYFH